MFLLRIIIIIALILLAIPFFNSAKDYVGGKARQVENAGKDTLDFFSHRKK